MKTFLTHLQEYGDTLSPHFNYGGSSIGPGLDQYVPMADLNAQSQKEIKKSDLDQIEKYADRLFASLGIDVEFTRHFLDRVNDSRNVKQITPAELTRLFKQSYKRHGKTIAKLGPDAEAVINDMKTDINMPFVLNLKGGELELVAKTVMRKKNFKTPDKKLSFESFSGTSTNLKNIVKSLKLLNQYRKTGKDEDAFKAIKFGWSFIQNPKLRKSIVSLIKYVAEKNGHNNWNETVKYIKKNTGVDISDYKQDWTRVKGGYTFTTFVPEQSNPRIPRKKGQPAGSKKHSDLYTDENPKGTIHGLGFKDVETARSSVNKIKNSGKTHAHKIQAAVAMEQRAREMGKTAEANVYRTYIDMMKKKTKEMQKEDFEFFPKKLYERITLPNPPTDLDRELEILKRIMNGRTEVDEESIRNHDEHAFYAIEKYCEKHGLIFHDREMSDIVIGARDTIGHFKEKFNVIRPFDLDKSIEPMGSKTNKTKSYPSGHATQSRLVGLYVASKFPVHKDGVMESAKECGIGRVLAGFHYLSDYVCGNLLADKMFLVMNKDNYGKTLKGED